MIDPSTIFQRTHAGREEIYQKSGGLTQSERLVLIMVDGAASFQAVRSKLPVLTDDRFKRAFQTLQKKELILEVFLPLENQAADALEETVIDRFLQQDPLDPLTIILRDPEEELALIGKPSFTPHQPTSAFRNETASSMQDNLSDNQFPSRDHDVEELERLADEVTKEVRARQSARPRRENTDLELSLAPHQPVERPLVMPSGTTPGYVHWGYLLVGIGLALILGFTLGRLAH